MVSELKVRDSVLIDGGHFPEVERSDGGPGGGYRAPLSADAAPSRVLDSLWSHTLTVLPRSAGALVSLILDFNYRHRRRVDLHQRVKSQ